MYCLSSTSQNIRNFFLNDCMFKKLLHVCKQACVIYLKIYMRYTFTYVKFYVLDNHPSMKTKFHPKFAPLKDIFTQCDICIFGSETCYWLNKYKSPCINGMRILFMYGPLVRKYLSFMGGSSNTAPLCQMSGTCLIFLKLGKLPIIF